MKDLANKKLLKEWKKIETANIFSNLEEFADFYYANGEKSCYRKYTSYPWSTQNFFFGTYEEFSLFQKTTTEIPFYLDYKIGTKIFNLTILSFLHLIGSLLLIVYCTDLPIWGYITLIFIFSLAVTGLYVFPKTGLHFNYKLGVIKYLGPHKISKRVIKMDEIKKIDFIVVYTPKGTGMPPKDYIAYHEKVY